MFTDIPAYINWLFLLTALLTVGFLYVATPNKKPFLTIVFVWGGLQSVLAFLGVYDNTMIMPPRFPLLVAPVIFFMLYLFRYQPYIQQNTNLRTLTYLHIIRIPVELCLLWLYQAGKVPQEMTFEGFNFDILSGITAPIIAYFVFDKSILSKKILFVWNILALLLLANIVGTAILSIHTPFQQFGFAQPNVAILKFPFVLLPSLIVPIVLYSHLVALFSLLKSKSENMK